MSTATTRATEADEALTDTRKGWLIIGVLIVAAALAGFLVGRDHPPSSKTFHGTAYVGGDQASMKVDDWTYGFQLDGIEWRDAQGGWHHGDRPACLRCADIRERR